MAPALVAVGTYALLLAWNEYLYQFLLLSSERSMTVPVDSRGSSTATSRPGTT
jgi:multiple sugar transport system permease protein